MQALVRQSSTTFALTPTRALPVEQVDSGTEQDVSSFVFDDMSFDNSFVLVSEGNAAFCDVLVPPAPKLHPLLRLLAVLDEAFAEEDEFPLAFGHDGLASIS